MNLNQKKEMSIEDELLKDDEITVNEYMKETISEATDVMLFGRERGLSDTEKMPSDIYSDAEEIEISLARFEEQRREKSVVKHDLGNFGRTRHKRKRKGKKGVTK